MTFTSVVIVSMRIRRSRPVLMMRVTVIRGAIVIKVFVKHLSSSKILIWIRSIRKKRELIWKRRHVLFVLTIIGCYFANMVLYLYYQMRGLTILPIMMIWQFNVVRMMNVWNILNRRCVWQPRICLWPEPLIRWRVPHGEQHWRLVPEHWYIQRVLSIIPVREIRISSRIW